MVDKGRILQIDGELTAIAAPRQPTGASRKGTADNAFANFSAMSGGNFTVEHDRNSSGDS